MADRGVLAAVQRFPESAGEIRRLALADAAFRALCSDLVEAQAALVRWTEAEGARAADRRREYDVLVRELADEIAEAIRHAAGTG